MSEPSLVGELVARLGALDAEVGRLRDIEAIRATKYHYPYQLEVGHPGGAA